MTQLNKKQVTKLQDLIQGCQNLVQAQYDQDFDTVREIEHMEELLKTLASLSLPKELQPENGEF